MLRLLGQRSSYKAQGLVEYALIILFVALVVITLLVLFGGTLFNMFNNIVEGF